MTASLPGPLSAPSESPDRRRQRARGLTLWAVVAMALSPFSVPTFGAGALLGMALIVVALLLERRGIRARGPLVAGIVAVASSLAFAGACGFLVLRTAEVTGREEARQDRVERRFDRAFDAAGRAPPSGTGQRAPGGDAGAYPGTDSLGHDVVDRGRDAR
ncbi:MAG: cytochrome d ubiquinol oxidase subunit II [Deltaproteobacteria bacterium]|nr:cytochrome d ubiquinol oxidase subunit II [Deltaproteobacteria bacterium]